MGGVITRFAPSPTGPLHLGHAFSALYAYDFAHKNKGTFLLRIEDIDQTRARSKWETQIYDDLSWLGLTWDAPPMRQSDRLGTYQMALERLWQMGLLYPCACKRRDIIAAASAPQEGAPLLGPDGVVYPGTCRCDPAPNAPMPANGTALRLNIKRAFDYLRMDQLSYTECDTSGGSNAGLKTISRETALNTIGDVVLSRRDFLGSYHLSVVCDDSAADITHVIRGVDLADATPIHVLLQKLLGFAQPKYLHHRLIRDDQGKRLAKRDDARALALLRAEGTTPQDIRNMLGL